MKEIYELAKKAGACSPGLREIQNAISVNDLIRLMKTGKGIEFIMETNFLTKTVYNQYRSELEKENIFLDGPHKLVNPRLVIIMGDTIDIEISGFQVCEIYAKNSAVVNIVAHDNAYVSVELRQDAKVKIESYEQSKVKEYRK
ncbi:hypothetical protein [Sphingobacterium sp. JUb56]|uniref:hypothetical protein n=1 Tax=Sphingobacterium sp. JUb56 TaxID=2587145 RepID=UPI0016122191|nr:hypothetical protein [Sphingobacterium sp. JUb56]MBB2951961.1 hypothetical protein [Sphingobacterium sp. JUb56]